MNDLEFIEMQVNVLRKMYKTNLERKLKNLIFDLEQELSQLKTNPHYRPNSCGIIQGSAQDIDELCIKLGVLDSVMREY